MCPTRSDSCEWPTHQARVLNSGADAELPDLGCCSTLSGAQTASKIPNAPGATTFWTTPMPLVVVEVVGREPPDGRRAGFGSVLQRLPPQGLGALEVSETMLDVGQRHDAIHAEQRLKPAGRGEAGIRDRAHAERLLQISCLRFDPTDHRATARAHDRVQEACVDQDFLCPIAFFERLIHITSRDVHIGHRREHVGARRRPDLPELRQDLLGPPDVKICEVILANLRVHQGSDHDRARCILRLS
mmetsp:Transcript_11147/g.28741  ORF Transcript_11147/g.28741 Transcript_11147/m.28741 type:complete len:244 (-) Transcript_11147:96-827(-)